MDYASFAYRTERFSFPSDKLTCSVIAPFPQKAAFASAKRLQARAFYADWLTTTFLRLPPSAVLTRVSTRVCLYDPPDHVAMDYASFAYRTERFSFPSDKLTCSVIAPFPQKAAFASAKRLQARAFYADWLTTTFLRLPPSVAAFAKAYHAL